jgi:hypothetical protein
MSSNSDLIQLKKLAMLEFSDIIDSAFININKLRIFIKDGSFLEVFTSYVVQNRWAFHWERRNIDKTIYRHDNIPHKDWNRISSFPWHYHEKNQGNVKYISFGPDPSKNLRSFLNFIKNFLDKGKTQ